MSGIVLSKHVLDEAIKHADAHKAVAVVIDSSLYRNPEKIDLKAIDGDVIMLNASDTGEIEALNVFM